MSTFRYYVASSLDGYIADRRGGLDWLLAFGMDDYSAHYERFLAGIGAVVMGASTYDFLVEESPGEWPYAMPCWVITHGRDIPEGFADADIRFVSGGVGALREEILEAAGDRDVWVVGGGETAAQFAHAGMLDELLVTIMPVVLGDGKPLLPIVNGRRLEASGTTAFPSGAIELRYRLTDDMSA